MPFLFLLANMLSGVQEVAPSWLQIKKKHFLILMNNKVGLIKRSLFITEM